MSAEEPTKVWYPGAPVALRPGMLLDFGAGRPSGQRYQLVGHLNLELGMCDCCELEELIVRLCLLVPETLFKAAADDINQR